MIKAALKKVGVDPNSPKLLAIGFGAMRSALNNGQIDAFWAPEPFVSQGLNIDGDRIVMAPGPVLGKFWPIGGYGALDSWVSKNPQLAKSFHEAINESLAYAQAHPTEIRALLPAGTQNVRLPIWSPVVDRTKLVQLAKYAKEFGVIDSLPNMARLVPSTVTGGKVLQGTVGNVFITLRLDGKACDDTAARQVHGRRHRQLEDDRIQARRPRRDEADEREGDRAEHVDADPEEGQVRLQLDHAPEAQAHVEDHLRPSRVDGVPAEGAVHALQRQRLRRERLRRRYRDVEQHGLVARRERRHDRVELVRELRRTS